MIAKDIMPHPLIGQSDFSRRQCLPVIVALMNEPKNHNLFAIHREKTKIGVSRAVGQSTECCNPFPHETKAMPTTQPRHFNSALIAAFALPSSFSQLVAVALPLAVTLILIILGEGHGGPHQQTAKNATSQAAHEIQPTAFLHRPQHIKLNVSENRLNCLACIFG